MELILQGYDLLKTINKNKTIEELLDLYEKGIKSSVVCQVLAIKAINEIEISKKWLEIENYSSDLLNSFKERNISEPQKLSFKDWIVSIYPHFSYINYITISGVIAQIPYEYAERLTDDALKELGKAKNRDRVHKFLPLIDKSKDKIIRKYQIMQMADTLSSKEKPMPYKKISKKFSMLKEENKIGRDASLTAHNNRLKTELQLCVKELDKSNSYIKELEKTVAEQKEEIIELKEENKELTVELRRYRRK